LVACHDRGVSSVAQVPPSYEDLVAMLVELRERVDRLEAENADLKRRLGLNSSNSSKPPSSDGLDRPARQPGKGSGRRRGKQPGAPGWTLELVADPDEVVEHRPQRCVHPGCGSPLSDGREYGRQRRQVIELPERRPVVVEHRLIVGAHVIPRGLAQVIPQVVALGL
jgi:transposase